MDKLDNKQKVKHSVQQAAFHCMICNLVLQDSEQFIRHMYDHANPGSEELLEGGD